MTVLHKYHSFKSAYTGATLIELIVTIIIISVSLTGIFSIVNYTTSHSVDPMLQQQAIAVAESYIEEITLLTVNDPNGSNTGETRSSFDNIYDYDGLNDVGARDQNANVITGLENYTVSVSIEDELISTKNMTVITVTVSRAGTQTITLTAYRADYN